MIKQAFLWIFLIFLSLAIPMTAIAQLPKFFSETWLRPIDAEQVTIVRDDWGVPHIYGRSDAETVYGLAWASCEDNFDAIQLPFAASFGRASRYFGKEGALFDVVAFIAQVDPIVEAQYDTSFSSEFKKMIEAYVQGINDYAAAHPKEIRDRKAFPITPKTLIKSYLLGQVMLSSSAFEIAKIQSGYVKNLELKEMGSNGFAFSKKKLKEEQTLLISNTHQPLEGPLAWYEVHLNSEEGWNMLGATFPSGMTPFLGVNPNLGWTHTVNHPDLYDTYKLVMHPKNKRHYRFDGEWLPLEVKKLKLKVKIGPIRLPISFKFYKSKHGMVLKNKTGFYALRFVVGKRLGAAEQWYQMNKARNLAEFKEALQAVKIPSLNVLYADKADNILFYSNGQIPNQRNVHYDWHKVLPGDTSATLWPETFYAMEDLPQLENPASAYLFNANNTPFNATADEEDLLADDFPNAQMGFLTLETNRSLRIEELMENYDRISIDEVMGIKYDVQYASGKLYNYTISNLEEIRSIDIQKYPDLKDVAALLQAWDMNATVDSKKGTIAAVAITEVVDYLGEKGIPLDENIIPEEVFIDALRWAKRYLLRRYGTLEVELGKIQQHRRKKGSDLSYPMEGMPETIAAMYIEKDGKGYRTTLGESYILVACYDEKGLNRLETVVPFGASNRPDSPHYTDQMKLYTQQKRKTMTLDKETIFEQAGRIYHPEPLKNLKK